MASQCYSNILASQLLIFFLFFLSSLPQSSSSSGGDCETELRGGCYDEGRSLKLKLIAIPAILAASMAGVCLPLFSRHVPALRPDRKLFVVVKAFASGVILATGFMHVLPDSFNDLSSPCLPERPWKEFPFTTFVAMVSAVMTLMLDSFMMASSQQGGRRSSAGSSSEVADHASPQAADYEQAPPPTSSSSSSSGVVHGHGAHGQFVVSKDDDEEKSMATLRRYRIIAQVLEMGIVVHSVVIGLSMGASQNPCTIRPLVAALCFHQLFEGMGLGGCILQAEYGRRMKSVLVFFFSTTTPFGIALGIAISKVYSSTSPTALIVVGILNASSAGILIYMALVDLLATDFLGARLQASLGLQAVAYAAVLLGAGGMSVMAKWA